MILLLRVTPRTPGHKCMLSACLSNLWGPHKCPLGENTAVLSSAFHSELHRSESHSEIHGHFVSRRRQGCLWRGNCFHFRLDTTVVHCFDASVHQQQSFGESRDTTDRILRFERRQHVCAATTWISGYTWSRAHAAIREDIGKHA